MQDDEAVLIDLPGAKGAIRAEAGIAIEKNKLQDKIKARQVKGKTYFVKANA